MFLIMHKKNIILIFAIFVSFATLSSAADSIIMPAASADDQTIHQQTRRQTPKELALSLLETKIICLNHTDLDITFVATFREPFDKGSPEKVIVSTTILSDRAVSVPEQPSRVTSMPVRNPAQVIGAPYRRLISLRALVCRRGDQIEFECWEATGKSQVIRQPFYEYRICCNEGQQRVSCFRRGTGRSLGVSIS